MLSKYVSSLNRLVPYPKPFKGVSALLKTGAQNQFYVYVSTILSNMCGQTVLNLYA